FSQFAGGYVQLRAGQAICASMGITHRRSTAEYPQIRAIRMLYSMFAFKAGSGIPEMSDQIVLDLFPVIRMDTLKPLINVGSDFILPVPKYLLPALGKIDFVRLQIPIPNAVIR